MPPPVDLAHLDQLLTTLRRHGVEQYKDELHGLALVLNLTAPDVRAELRAEAAPELPASSADSLPAEDDDGPTWEDPV